MEPREPERPTGPLPGTPHLPDPALPSGPGELPPEPVVPDVPGVAGVEPELAPPELSEPVLAEPELEEPELGRLHVNSPETIRRLMTTPGRWAVVGLTNNPRRAAVGVSRFVRDELGMEIVPVNLTGESVHGERAYRRLADIPGRIDVVDCFVNSQRVGAIVDQAIEAGAKAVWLQLGVVDQAAAARAADAGLAVVMDTCPVIEARHLP